MYTVFSIRETYSNVCKYQTMPFIFHKWLQPFCYMFFQRSGNCSHKNILKLKGFSSGTSMYRSFHQQPERGPRLVIHAKTKLSRGQSIGLTSQFVYFKTKYHKRKVNKCIFTLESYWHFTAKPPKRQLQASKLQSLSKSPHPLGFREKSLEIFAQNLPNLPAYVQLVAAKTSRTFRNFILLKT